MDELDKELILRIENKGIQGYSDLANSYGVNERTIRRRVGNLIHSGLIRPLIVPNLVSLGFRAWARIGINVSLGSFSNVAQQLVNNPSVYFVAVASGRFDIIIASFFDTISKLAYFVNSELTKINGICATETFLLVHPRKYNLFSWLEPPIKMNKSFFDLASSNSLPYGKYQLGNIERTLLEFLFREGPTRPRELSAKLGISESVIRRRLKAMQAEELFKTEVIPITRETEFGARATMGITISAPNPHGIINTIMEHPAVSIASTALGRFNIILVTRFRNTNYLNQFVNEFLASIPGINSIETFLHVKRLKYYNITWPID